jgi:hypothetical protein
MDAPPEIGEKSWRFLRTMVAWVGKMLRFPFDAELQSVGLWALPSTSFQAHPLRKAIRKGEERVRPRGRVFLRLSIGC